MLQWWRVALFAPAFVLAMPTDHVVVKGSAEFVQGKNHLEIKTGDQAVLSWKGFDIGKGESVAFVQPGANSVVINHVVGKGSQILGNLSANGTIYLLNPNGIFIGEKAVIQVGSLVASTLSGVGNNVCDQYTLKNEGTGDIKNLGSISALHGDVILVSHHVHNGGEISAANGALALAAGDEVVIFPGKGARASVRASVGGEKGKLGIQNLGTLKGREVQLSSDGNLYSLAINQGGLVDAKIVRVDGGALVFAGETQGEEAVLVSGEKIHIEGRVVAPEIVATAIEHIGVSGEVEGTQIAFISKGKLKVDRDINLNEGGSIILGSVDMHPGRTIFHKAIKHLLSRGNVTLETTGSELIVGRHLTEVRPELSFESPYTLTFRAPMENGQIYVREGVVNNGSIGFESGNITVGFTDSATNHPILIESKEKNIDLSIGKGGVLHVCDSAKHLPTVITADQGDISMQSLGEGSVVLVGREKAGAENVSVAIKAGGLLIFDGIASLQLDAAGDSSSVVLDASGCGMRGVQNLEMVTGGKGSRVMVRGEKALALSVQNITGVAQGEGSSVEMSSERIRIESDKIMWQSVGEGSYARICANDLQLMTESEMVFDAVKGASEVILTGAESSRLVSRGDIRLTSSMEAEGVRIAEKGGSGELVLYAAKDMILDHLALVEVYESDLIVEAGGDIILKNGPRLLIQAKNGPSAQIMTHAVGQRGQSRLTLGEFFDEISESNQGREAWFADFANMLAKRPRMVIPDPINNTKSTCHNHKVVCDSLCKGMHSIGPQAKYAKVIRQANLQRSSSRVIEKSPGSGRPWKVRKDQTAVNEEEIVITE